MRVVVLGGSGQLGQSIVDVFSERQVEFVTPPRVDCDITNFDSVRSFLQLNKATEVINCAAWTNVDAAEDHVDETFLINSTGPKNLAQACKTTSSRLIHISTDYVFDGRNSIPYRVEDQTNPLNVYGRSKLLGEQYVRGICPNSSLVVRTAWLYSAYGTNFVKTVLKKAIQGEQLRIVNDVFGQPTSASTLAEQIYRLLIRPVSPGVYHGTNSGVASWFDLAETVLAQMKLPAKITPISSTDLKSKADRPKWSVLDHSQWSNIGFPAMPDWEESLSNYLPAIFEKVKKELNENHTTRN